MHIIKSVEFCNLVRVRGLTLTLNNIMNKTRIFIRAFDMYTSGHSKVDFKDKILQKGTKHTHKHT